jgi:hypothetical protein
MERGPLLAGVERLAFPRFPGTEGERRAADLVASGLEAAGLRVAREGFRASSTAVRRLRLLVHGAAAAGAAALALTGDSPGVALPLGAGLLVLVATSSRWRRQLESAFSVGPQIASRNVIGRRPGAEGGAQIVLMAHVDSKSAALPTFVPVVVILVTMALVLLATLLAGARLAGMAVPSLPPGVLLAAAAALLLIPLIPVGNRSPGAMDNASGLAVLLELARRLPADPRLEGAELIFLATGAEEIGLCGAMRWIQAHEGELDPGRAAVVNLDSVGVGEGLLAVDVRGRLGGRRMAEIVEEAAGRTGRPVRRLPFLPGVGVDTMPFGVRGFATVSVLGRVLGAASRRIHGPRDTLDLLNEGGLQHAVSLAQEIARSAAAVGRR